MSLNISWLDAITNKVINPSAIEDLVFRNAVLLAYTRKNAFEVYTGGVSMDNAFLNNAMIGGAFAKGDPLSTDVVEPIAGQTFPPRTYYTAVAHYLENLAINRGPAAVFKALSVKHRAAMNTINNIFNVALYRHGQATTTGIISGDRSTQTNGLDEALNDGATQGPFGDYFVSYAGQSRANTSELAAGYYSVPYFCGNATTGAGGEINYSKMLAAYLRAVKGNRKPNIALTSKSCWGFIAAKIQAQQIFQFTAGQTDAYFGADSIKFMGCDIMIDEYCPSTIDGVNDPRLGNYLLGTFAASTTNQQTLPGKMPFAGETVTAGEAIYWLNSEPLKFRLSDHPLFNFGWKVYVPQANRTKIVGDILAMRTLEYRAPWLGVIQFGINR